MCHISSSDVLLSLLLLARSGKGPSQGGGGGIPHQDVSYLCIFFNSFSLLISVRYVIL